MAYSQALEEQVATLGWLRSLKNIPQYVWQEGEEEGCRILEYGETYFWAKGLNDFLLTAALELPDSWQWTPEILPSFEGFLWFERPLELGCTHPDEGSDEAFSTITQAALAWSRGVIKETGVRVLNLYIFERGQRHPVLSRAIQLKAGQTIKERLFGGRPEDHDLMKFEGKSLAIADIALRTLAACLTFIDQRILVTPQHRADRPARRRLERAGYVREPVIRVVELRRKQARSEQSGESSSVEWTHQWVVSGHWRQQWYPSLNTHQPRWIMPYVKGPEDAPLKPPRGKVFAVVR